MFQLTPTFRSTPGVTLLHRDRSDLLLGRQKPAGIVFVALAMETRGHEGIESSEVEVCRTELYPWYQYVGRGVRVRHCQVLPDRLLTD